MTDFVRLPSVVLVEPAEVKALREKFAAAQSLVEHQKFWDYVQQRRQKPLIAENPDTFVSSWPVDANGSPVDFEALPV